MSNAKINKVDTGYKTLFGVYAVKCFDLCYASSEDGKANGFTVGIVGGEIKDGKNVRFRLSPLAEIFEGAKKEIAQGFNKYCEYFDGDNGKQEAVNRIFSLVEWLNEGREEKERFTIGARAIAIGKHEIVKEKKAAPLRKSTQEKAKQAACDLAEKKPLELASIFDGLREFVEGVAASEMSDTAKIAQAVSALEALKQAASEKVEEMNARVEALKKPLKK